MTTKEKIQTLIDYSNSITEQNSTTLSGAIRLLAEYKTLEKEEKEEEKFTPTYVNFYNNTTWTEIPSDYWVGFDSSKLTSWQYLFQANSKLTSLDMSPFAASTDNVTHTNNAFNGCSALKTIDNIEVLLNLPVVRFTDSMFQNLTSYTTIVKPGEEYLEFNLPKLYQANSMFQNSKLTNRIKLKCGDQLGYLQNTFSNNTILTDLAIEVNNNLLYDVRYACSGCTNLVNFSYNNSNPTAFSTSVNLTNMFNGCTKLQIADLSGISGKIASSSTYMFNNCKVLEKIDIRNLEFSGLSSVPSNMMTGVPTTCEIIVKNDNEVAWWNSKLPSYTNVHTL